MCEPVISKRARVCHTPPVMRKRFSCPVRGRSAAAWFAAAFVFGGISADAVAGPDSILPHRAGYALTLESVRQGSGIVDVTGVLSYDWADSCDGWIVEQRYVLQVIRDAEPPAQISASYANWESKDGLRYRFYVKRSRTARQGGDEEVQGEATLEAIGKPGVAEFKKPRREKIALPAGTSFPTAHTLALMKRAAAGDKFDRRPVFDGAEVEPPSAMTAFILPERDAPPNGHPKVQTDQQPVWPISIAVFAPDGKTAMPEFEMSIYLQRNGVVPELTMNYGDFTVRGRLQIFEPIKASEC